MGVGIPARHRDLLAETRSDALPTGPPVESAFVTVDRPSVRRCNSDTREGNVTRGCPRARAGCVAAHRSVAPTRSAATATAIHNHQHDDDDSKCHQSSEDPSFRQHATTKLFLPTCGPLMSGSNVRLPFTTEQLRELFKLTRDPFG